MVKYLKLLGNLKLFVYYKIFRNKNAGEILRWRRENGEKLRFLYDLNKDSVVFDIGGYEGEWASDIFSRYLSTIHIFEPVKSFSHNLKKRFGKNDKVFVHDFGLSDRNSAEKIFLLNDGSSLYKKNSPSEEIELVDVGEFIEKNSINTIDLMKINIEGGEYDLLDRLIETKLISMIDNIQIQFHDFVPHARSRMKNIQANLSKTHELTYQYEFVWENWQLKK